MRKNCSSDQEKLLKLEAEGREFSKKILTVGQNIFGNKIPFQACPYSSGWIRLSQKSISGPQISCLF